MTTPTGPPDVPLDPATELIAGLRDGEGRQLARAVRIVRRSVWVAAALISVTGIGALLLGLGAWGGSITGIVVVLLTCGPAVAAPIYVARRTSALAKAAAHPRELADQARDLITGLRASPELTTLARRLRGRSAGGVSGAPRGRFRNSLSLLRLVSSVVGQASPDPKRHPLVVPFQPERLRATWLAVIVSLWAWLAAAIVGLLAAVVLLARLA